MISEIAMKIKRAYDPVFANILFFNTIQTMFFICVGMLEIKSTNMKLKELFVNAKYVVMVDGLFFMTFFPAIFAGMLSSQAENIKHVLHDKLLDSRDENEAGRIKNFIHYVEAHPLKFTLYKVFPLDATLPGLVLNSCITYLIVIAQFAHVD